MYPCVADIALRKKELSEWFGKNPQDMVYYDGLLKGLMQMKSQQLLVGFQH